MTALKNLFLIILITGFIFVVVDMFHEPDVIDNTEYFRAENDSLKNVIDDIINSNRQKDLLILQIQMEFDSVVKRENKIHIFYAKDRKKLFANYSANDRVKLFNQSTGRR